MSVSPTPTPSPVPPPPRPISPSIQTNHPHQLHRNDDEYNQDNTDYATTNEYQSKQYEEETIEQQQQNDMNTSLQAMVSAAAAVNAKQLRNNVNEKRLLVKIIRATNLTSKYTIKDKLMKYIIN